MLKRFLSDNRPELIARCRARVAARSVPRATPVELEHGVPLLLDQLRAMLPPDDSQRDTAAVACERLSLPGAGVAGDASLHGEELMRHQFTIDQVVHNYGDLCQAVTELAFEQNAAITVHEFGILNITLDNAIAGAVSEFARQRERAAHRKGETAIQQRLGVLATELRYLLNTSILALAAIRSGSVGPAGATAGALDRSLVGMRMIIDETLAEVRSGARSPAVNETFELAPFVADIEVAAALEATTLKCKLTVLAVTEGIFVRADRHALSAAVSNLVNTAFRHSGGEGHLMVTAYAHEGQVFIDIEDSRGLPQQLLGPLFRPHDQQAAEHGSGPSLAVSRRSVEVNGGRLYARMVPGRDCVVTIELPQAA